MKQSKKQAKKLAKRQAAFVPSSAGEIGYGLMRHMPGSQNRKK